MAFERTAARGSGIMGITSSGRRNQRPFFHREKLSTASEEDRLDSSASSSKYASDLTPLIFGTRTSSRTGKSEAEDAKRRLGKRRTHLTLQ